MNEIELRELFDRFLVEEKYYPEASLLYEAQLPRVNEKVFYADLLIIGLSYREYVGIIEFSSRILFDRKDQLLYQIKTYRTSLGKPNIPAFVITEGQDNFVIFRITPDYNLIEIPKVQFPDYNSLTSEFVETSKIYELENIQNKEKEKSKNQKIRYFTSWIAIVMTITLTVTSILISDLFTPSGKNKVNLNEVMLYIDSLKNKVELQQNQINTELELIKNHPIDSESILEFLRDSLSAKELDNIKYSMKLNDIYQSQSHLKKMISELDNRYNVLAELISNDPIKTLRIINLQNDILILENNLNHKIELLQKDYSSLSDKYNFVIGGIITLILSILLLAIPNILKYKRES